MQQGFTESVVEEAALDWLEALGYDVGSGREIAVGSGRRPAVLAFSELLNIAEGRAVF